MDENLKAKLIPPLIGFNMTVILYQLIFNSGLFGSTFSVLNFLLGVLLGLVIGGITFAVNHFLLSG